MTGSSWGQSVSLPSKLCFVTCFLRNVTETEQFNINSYKTPFFAVFQLLGAGVYHLKVDNSSQIVFLSWLDALFIIHN